MTEPRELERLIARARQRAVSNLVWTQATVGVTAALAGAVVLMLVGTSILDWYWLVVLFAAGFGIGAWRTWRRLPTHYQVAQQVDQRLGLQDALSTAHHFGASPRAGSDPKVVAAQLASAESMAAGIAASDAWPYVLPRQTYHAAGLLAVVLALGILRYGTLGSLDLRTPMIRAVTDFFWTGEQQQARAKKSPPRVPGEDPLGIAIDQPDTRNFGEEPLSDDLLKVTETPEFDESSMANYTGKTDQKSLKAAGEESEGQDGSEESDAGKGEPGGDPESDTAGQKSGNEPAGGKSTPRDGNENSSLLDKMRDAMSNLLSKLNVQQPMTQSNEKGSGQEKQAKGGSGQKGEQSGKKQGKGSPSDDGDSSQEGQGQQQADAGQGKSSDNAGDSPSKDPNSGVGKQDGDKALRDAEQLAAMGKISEIFGKRAQNVTGEIMIEVNSGKQQQLRTAYSSSGASHREAGSEIHRDEVPLAYQQYVQKYFETVRSQESAAGGKQ